MSEKHTHRQVAAFGWAEKPEICLEAQPTSGHEPCGKDGVGNFIRMVIEHVVDPSTRVVCPLGTRVNWSNRHGVGAVVTSNRADSVSCRAVQ